MSNKLRVHYCMHAPFEKLGVIGDWVTQKGYELSGSHTYMGDKVPGPDSFDLLIIMGGPQNACALDRYPYLDAEIKLASQAITANKAVLGICLGAQIIAESLGAKTQTSPKKEIGVYPVTLTAEGKKDPLFGKFAPQFNVMHWHNDMPSLPDGGVLLAKSEGCPHQAFRYSDRVYGLQFHLEMNTQLVKGMLENCSNDLQPGRFIATPEELLATNFIEMNHKMIMTLDYLAHILL